MRLHYKILGVLLLAFLIPVIVLGSGGYLSIKSAGDRAAGHSVRALLDAEHDRLLNDTRSRAIGLEELCSRFESEVVHIASRVARTRNDLALYRLESLPQTYPDRDTGSLPPYGFLDPAHGSYADFEKRGHASPWVPRPTFHRIRKDPAHRAEVVASLHTVMILNEELVDAHRRFPKTLDLAWIVLASGVSNAHPPYDYSESIARNPGIVDIDESEQNYVVIATPAANPNRTVRWVEPYLDHFKGVWMTSCVAPVYHENSFLGAVGIDVLMSVVTDHVLRSTSKERGFAFLLGPSGSLVAIPEHGIDEVLWNEAHRRAVRESFRPTAQQRWTGEMVDAIKNTKLGDSPNADLREVVEQMKLGGSGIRTFRLGSTAKLVAFHPVRTPGWSLAVVVPVEQVLGPSREVREMLDSGINRALRDYVLLGLLGALVSVIVAGILHQRVIRPLGQFTKSVADVRWDNLDVTLPDSSGRDELGRLYGKFAGMLRLLRRARDEATLQRAALEEANDKLQTANEKLAEENEVRRVAEAALAKEKGVDLELTRQFLRFAGTLSAPSRVERV